MSSKRPMIVNNFLCRLLIFHFHFQQNIGINRGEGVSNWLMIYGGALRLKGAFSSYLVYKWVGFCPIPNAHNLQNWVYFEKLGRKNNTQFVPNYVFLVAIWQSKVYFEHSRTKLFEEPPPPGIDIISATTCL